MRWLLRATLLIPFLCAASAPEQIEQGPTLEARLASARAEQETAEAETAKLEESAAGARSEAQRFAAEEAAAAQGIEAAEARITAADMAFRLAAADVALNRERLEREEQPISSLLLGLAMTARRPPLLALLDSSDSDDLVKVSVLLDSTLPVIRSRTRALSAELIRSQDLESNARLARAELVKSRQALDGRRSQFADLERKAFERSFASGGQALSTSDAAIAAGEQVEQLKGAVSDQRSALETARALEAEPEAPPRPFAPSGAKVAGSIAYSLPVNAPVAEGLGSVNSSGVRSRGILFETVRGAPVTAPADSVVRFSGPFRDYDGVIILDHGGGWMTLIVNLASELKPGDRVRAGDLLGRALGPVEVELSNSGKRISPALIAGSSPTLSNGVKGG